MKPKPHVLIVDDSATARAYMRDLVGGCLDADVQTENSAWAALGRIVVGHWDLLILDVMMPELNGIDLLLLLQQFHFAIPPTIIATASAASDSMNVTPNSELGIMAVVNKTAPVEELQDVIRAVLGVRP